MRNGKIGIGIIGFGGIAQGAHAPGYRRLADECEIVAVADIAPERREQAQSERWNIPHVTDNYHKLLEMPEVDAVSVCTPNLLHKQPTIDALRAGKHVLCEKPMAMNSAECREMIAAASETGSKLQIGYNMRFHPGAQSLKRAVEQGVFGEVYHARAQAIRRRRVPAFGVFIEKDKQGGGPLIDIGVHITDMTLWLAGHPKPASAVGSVVTKFGNRAGILGEWGQWDPTKYTVEDFAVALIRFENGLTMSLEASFIANIAKEEFSTHLFGVGAGAYFDANAGKYTMYREEFGTLTDSTPGYLPSVQSTHSEEIRAFLAAIRDDRTIEEMGAATGEQALMVTQIMDAIYRSAETGQETKIA